MWISSSITLREHVSASVCFRSACHGSWEIQLKVCKEAFY